MEPQQTINILLVDDRPENLLALEAALLPLGVDLIKAGSGAEALKQVLVHEFAVILLDVKMPGMDGFETAALIRKREKSAHTPIIFITAQYREDEHLSRGYAVGAVDYIIKPFVADVLKSKISVFIDLYRKTEETKRQAELILEMKKREYEVRLNEAKNRAEQQALRTKMERRVAQAVVEHAPMGILRLDSHLVIAEVNQVFSEQFNVLPEAVIRKELLEALPWLPPPLIEAIQQAKQYRMEQFKITIDENVEESERYLDLAVWPIKGQEQGLVGTILVAVDVTDRVWLDQQREDFVATLAHDLQTPVIASNRALELILSQPSNTLDPESLKLASMLKKNNENLLSMIQSLLDVYRYESGGQSLYLDNVDLRLLISTCLDELTPLAQKQGVKLTSQLPLDLSFARADRTAIRRVLTNLLDNSIKFTPPGGSIVVRARNSVDMVIFEVVDTGAGIALQDQLHLFKRFWHGSGHKTYKASCGLGLYLCKRIIEAHNGQITCESEVGKGTTFSVAIPGAVPDGTTTAILEILEVTKTYETR